MIRARYAELVLAVGEFERLSPLQQAARARDMLARQLAFLGVLVDSIEQLQRDTSERDQPRSGNDGT